jgi:hypothetical protein
MAKGEVVLTAKQVKKRKKTEKIATIVLLLLLLFLVVAYFILNIVYNEGSFTISMDKNTYLESNLVMYESLNDRSSVLKISTSKLAFMDNISINWLPENINKEAEGSHNGENYIAHSFYLENQGEETINYWYSVQIDDIIKNVDDAARIMIYINDDRAVYAKKSPITGKPEDGTKEFRSDDTIILEKRDGLNPGERDKVTIVIWLEGDDPECVNAILGGEMKMHMDIYEEHVEEKNIQ